MDEATDEDVRKSVEEMAEEDGILGDIASEFKEFGERFCQ